MQNLSSLMELLRAACTAAVQDYVRGIDPERDRIKQAEAKRYLVSRGYKPAMLSHLVSAGLVKKHKTGRTKNCATLYSLAEIKQALAACKLSAIVNDF